MFKQIYFALFLFLFSQTVWSQEENSTHKETKGKLEVITSGVYAYSFENEESVIGAEVHLTYWFNHKWGTGVSYTAKFEDKETLNDIALLGSWNPTKWMTLNVGPNFGLSGEHRDFEISFYSEAEINIRPTEWFHFGPVIGTVLGESSEISGGIHLGFEF